MTQPQNGLWEVKINNTYTKMKTPSQYNLSLEDLDTNSYRSITNGNLNRTILGKKWVSCKMTYSYLTESELETLSQAINIYPMNIKLKSPLFGTNGIWEGQMYCSKFSVDMQQNKDNNEQTWASLSFTLVQSKKVSGQ